ncbi:MAG: NUDIX domain-containing protein [Gammaproteobacteria bacterium]|nr:NUDIX domain-containing protein [Gammaproteobacteria bacterium]
MKYHCDVKQKKILYQGFNQLLEFKFKFSKFDGTMSGEIARELFYRNHCVGLMPYDPIRQEIILIEQCRIGPLINNDHPWTLEIIAGIVDEDENKDSTIIRESLEEANCEIQKLIPIYQYYMTPGCSNETMKLYCGLIDTSRKTTGEICGLPEEAEDIKVHVIRLKDAFDMLDTDKINNASTIIALQWLKLNCLNLS